MVKLIIIILIFTFNIISEDLSKSTENTYSTDSLKTNNTIVLDSDLISINDITRQLTNNKKTINRLYDWLLSHENTIDSLKQVINNNINDTYLDAKSKYLQIENLYTLADSIKKKSYYEKSPQKHDLKLKAMELYKQADTALSNWKLTYSLYSDVIKTSKKKIKKDFYQLGSIIQITAGITAAVLTIIYANREEKIKTDIPAFNSRGVQTGTESLTMTYKNKWTMGNTISAVLSGGLVVSGLITLSISY